MHNSFGNNYGIHPFWWSLIILIVLGIIFYLLDIIKQKSNNTDTLRTLKKKLAKGEISIGEYKKLKNKIKKNN